MSPLLVRVLGHDQGGAKCHSTTGAPGSEIVNYQGSILVPTAGAALPRRPKYRCWEIANADGSEAVPGNVGSL